MAALHRPTCGWLVLAALLGAASCADESDDSPSPSVTFTLNDLGLRTLEFGGVSFMGTPAGTGDYLVTSALFRTPADVEKRRDFLRMIGYKR